jgi:cytochrome P450/NADPH-cytochrome P450 reductase
MGDFLLECDNRTQRPAIVQRMMRGTTAKYKEDMKIMNDLANESAVKLTDIGFTRLTNFVVVEMRKADPIEKKDLLTLMLNGRDTKTGKGLDDRNIAENVSGPTFP